MLRYYSYFIDKRRCAFTSQIQLKSCRISDSKSKSKSKSKSTNNLVLHQCFRIPAQSYAYGISVYCQAKRSSNKQIRESCDNNLTVCLCQQKRCDNIVIVQLSSNNSISVSVSVSVSVSGAQLLSDRKSQSRCG